MGWEPTSPLGEEEIGLVEQDLEKRAREPELYALPVATSTIDQEIHPLSICLHYKYANGNKSLPEAIRLLTNQLAHKGDTVIGGVEKMIRDQKVEITPLDPERAFKEMGDYAVNRQRQANAPSPTTK